MEEYLLSIIIPTKDRAIYANKCIRQVLGCNDNRVQIVVQDNSSNDELEKMIEDVKDLPNMTYQHTEKLLSFVDNFDYAIQLAKGKYVSMIGDDDGITSMLLRIAEWADEKNIESIKPNLKAVYFWPGSKVYEKSEDTGKLRIDNSSGKIEWKDPHEGVIHLLKNGCQDYLDFNLVKIYHGLIRRDLLEKIKRVTGRYVAGLSPDIYLSVALSIMAEQNIAIIDIPITISGICKGSGSSQSSTGEHTGELKDAPHFKGHDYYAWKKDVPEFYSVETIWADSALAAVEDIRPELRKEYDSCKLIIDTSQKYENYKSLIWDNYIHHGGNRCKYVFHFVKDIILRGYKSIRYRLSKHKRSIFECMDIHEASKICERELSNSYQKFESNTRMCTYE